MYCGWVKHERDALHCSIYIRLYPCTVGGWNTSEMPCTVLYISYCIHVLWVGETRARCLALFYIYHTVSMYCGWVKHERDALHCSYIYHTVSMYCGWVKHERDALHCSIYIILYPCTVGGWNTSEMPCTVLYISYCIHVLWVGETRARCLALFYIYQTVSMYCGWVKHERDTLHCSIYIILYPCTVGGWNTSEMPCTVLYISYCIHVLWVGETRARCLALFYIYQTVSMYCGWVKHERDALIVLYISYCIHVLWVGETRARCLALFYIYHTVSMYCGWVKHERDALYCSIYIILYPCTVGGWNTSEMPWSFYIYHTVSMYCGWVKHERDALHCSIYIILYPCTVGGWNTSEMPCTVLYISYCIHVLWVGETRARCLDRSIYIRLYPCTVGGWNTSEMPCTVLYISYCIHVLWVGETRARCLVLFYIYHTVSMYCGWVKHERDALIVLYISYCIHVLWVGETRARCLALFYIYHTVSMYCGWVKHERDALHCSIYIILYPCTVGGWNTSRTPCTVLYISYCIHVLWVGETRARCLALFYIYHTVSMYCGWVKHERDALHCSIYIILYPCTVGGWNTSEIPCIVLYISYCIHVLWVGETRARYLALFYIYHTVSMYCGWVKHEWDALHCSIYIILYPCTVGGWNTSRTPCTVLYISDCIHVLWVGETRARCLVLFYIYHTVPMYCGWVKHEWDALHCSIYIILYPCTVGGWNTSRTPCTVLYISDCIHVLWVGETRARCLALFYIYHTVSMYCGWVKHERDALHCSIYIRLYPCTVGGWNTSEMPCIVLYISYCTHVLWVGETRVRCLALFYIYHTVSMYCGWVKHEQDTLHCSIYIRLYPCTVGGWNTSEMPCIVLYISYCTHVLWVGETRVRCLALFYIYHTVSMYCGWVKHEQDTLHCSIYIILYPCTVGRWNTSEMPCTVLYISYCIHVLWVGETRARCLALFYIYHTVSMYCGWVKHERDALIVLYISYCIHVLWVGETRARCLALFYIYHTVSMYCGWVKHEQDALYCSIYIILYPCTVGGWNTSEMPCTVLYISYCIHVLWVGETRARCLALFYIYHTVSMYCGWVKHERDALHCSIYIILYPSTVGGWNTSEMPCTVLYISYCIHVQWVGETRARCLALFYI